MSKCKAIIEFGDDHGDNSTTFHCKLDEGHEGDHRETGALHGLFPYDLSWKGDMTEKPAEKCDGCGSTNLAPLKDEYLTDWMKCKDCGEQLSPVPTELGIKE